MRGPLFSILLLLLSVHGFAAETCGQLLNFVRTSDPETRLQVTPGMRIPYDHNPERYRLADAFLTLSTDDDLKLVAKVLAQGRSPKKIYKQLKKRVKAPATQISLLELAPQMVGELTNHLHACDGPNCWNASLNWYAPDTGVRYIGKEKMERRIRADFELINEMSELHFGDMIAVRHNHVLVHTMIYLGGGIIWHKASALQQTPWTFELLADTFAYYQDRLRKGFLEIELYRRKQN